MVLLPHHGVYSSQLVFRPSCRPGTSAALSIAKGEAGLVAGGYCYRLVRRTVTSVQLFRDAVRQNIRSIESGWKYNFVERHGHKPMTVSNGFRFRLGRRGLRRMLVRARREEGSSLYEFAMVLPVLSMLLVGIIYGGITFYDYAMLNYAVAIGAKTVANNRAVGSATPNACTLGENALTKAAYNFSGVITINNGAGQRDVRRSVHLHRSRARRYGHHDSYLPL